MTNRYVIKFTKNGYVKYTSHLDLLRVFKRAFKKNGLGLRYSQGFNPHPKMGFAQPLSLGYSSKSELIEFELNSPADEKVILNKMQELMPEGIHLLDCFTLAADIKSLAACADAALYKIWIPTDLDEAELKSLFSKYLEQNEIHAMKRQKKTKQLQPVNIKHMIREGEILKLGEFAMIRILLDCGSQSNCSPELVISSFCEFAGIDTPRYDIEVEREELFFTNNLQF